MMKVFDAHVHFDEGSSERIKELFDKGILNGATVILNTEHDFRALEQNPDMLPHEKVRYAVIADPAFSEPLEFVERLKPINMAIKLHPRLSRLTAEDIPSVCSMVKKASSDVIIVDCMGYGHQYKNHIGLELGIELASALPEKKIVFAHAGGERLMDCFLYTRTLENAYYDISLVSTYFKGTHVYDDLSHFIRYNTGRIMFGSDHPDFDPEYCIGEVKKLCEIAGLNEEDTEKIFYGNAVKVYGKAGE